MESYVDTIDLEVQKKPIWNVVQLFLASFCLVSPAVLFKIPIDLYFGSGWSLVIIILFPIIFGGPFIFLQIYYGSIFKCGNLGIMERNIPLGLCFSIGCLLRNLIHIIFTSGIISHCVTYIFFTLFNCDNKLCYGGTFPWSSCKDSWVDGSCTNDKLVLNNPTAEEQFYQNFIMQQTSQIYTTKNFPTWFEYPALITVPHLIGWLFLFLLVINGAKTFGSILYGLIPLSVISFLVAFIYSVLNANKEGQWKKFLHHFFQNFPNHVPVVANQWDQYAFEPLIWGLLSTFVHLTVALNVWNGIYPIMGKWIGYGTKRIYFSWLLVIFPFMLIVLLTSIGSVALLSSKFGITYLRCHVNRDFAFPFTVAAHVFSELGTHEAIVVLYYLATLLFLLGSESLLFITTVESIIDHLRLWHDSIANKPLKSYRIIALCLLIATYFLSYTTILRSGIYWIQLMDFYLDRLLGVLMVGQLACLLVVFALSKQTGIFRHKLVKLLTLIFFAIIGILTFGILIWYAVNAGSRLPTQDCHYERLDPKLNPIPFPYNMVGWLISASPLLLGVIVGLNIIVVHSKKNGRDHTSLLTYLFRGETGKHVPAPQRDNRSKRNTNYGSYEDEIGLVPMNRGGTFTNSSTRPLQMERMRDTLQTEASYYNYGDSTGIGTGTGTGNGNNNNNMNYSQVQPQQQQQKQQQYQQPMLMYDQRQSLRRPLISPTDSASQLSSPPPSFEHHEYAQVNKRKRPTAKAQVQHHGPRSTHSDV